jgi:hypothetical protein
MSDVFSKSNKMAVSFVRLNDAFASRGRMLIVNTLVKGEVGNHTNIRELSMEMEIRCIVVERGGRHSVHDEGAIVTAKGPTFGWSVGGVHDAMHHFLHFLPLTLSVVLVLVTRLTLPTLNDQGTKNVLDTVTDLNRRTVTDEFVHGSLMADFIFESVDECVGRMHIVESREESTAPNEELQTGDTADSDNVATNGIGSNSFMTLVNVTGGKRRAISIAKSMTRIGSTMRVLGRAVIIGILDKGRRRPQEKWTPRLIVMLLGSNDGRSGIDVVQGCGRDEVVNVNITTSSGTTYVGTSLG